MAGGAARVANRHGVDAASPQLRKLLTGVWAVQAAGLQSQLVLAPDGTYSNVLAGGMQGHSGTWAVTANLVGGQSLVFSIKDAFPKEFVGPLGSSPIVWPTSETWYVMAIHPDRIDINGGFMVRAGVTPDMMRTGASAGPGVQGPAVFPGAFPMAADPNAQVAAEMRQIADAGRTVFGKLKSVWSGLKKR